MGGECREGKEEGGKRSHSLRQIGQRPLVSCVIKSCTGTVKNPRQLAVLVPSLLTRGTAVSILTPPQLFPHSPTVPMTSIVIPIPGAFCVLWIKLYGRKRYLSYKISKYCCLNVYRCSVFWKSLFHQIENPVANKQEKKNLINFCIVRRLSNVDRRLPRYCCRPHYRARL